MPDPPVDDRTATYILETRKCFEDLRQVASQIAGVLVLKASGAESATPGHPALAAAAELHQVAIEELRRARPTERSREHHHWLTQSADALSTALSGAGNLDVDSVLPSVRAAYDHLQRASQNLPGFPMVAFEQGCCGMHIAK